MFADVDEYETTTSNVKLDIANPKDGCSAADVSVGDDQSVAVLPIDGGAKQGFRIVDSSNENEELGTAKCPTQVADGSPMDNFVQRARPEWNMARANSHDSCWPAEAIYADGDLNPGAKIGCWPNSNSGCPAVGSAFPTYYTAKVCKPDEIRVAYTLYIPNSGFDSSCTIHAEQPFDGHTHDFEGVYVVWKRNADGDQWNRDRLIMSRHSDHPSTPWSEVESWDAAWSSAGLGRDFPRIFMGWGSHAMFNNQGGLKDALSQLYDQEYRHADYPAHDYKLVEVTEDNNLGKQFEKAKDHFDAGLLGNPVTVAGSLCDL